MGEQLYTREITIYSIVGRVPREQIDFIVEQASLVLGVNFIDITSKDDPVVYQFKAYTPGFIVKRSVAEKKLAELLKDAREIFGNVSYWIDPKTAKREE